jgi:hypothetical protein
MDIPALPKRELEARLMDMARAEIGKRRIAKCNF